MLSIQRATTQIILPEPCPLASAPVSPNDLTDGRRQVFREAPELPIAACLQKVPLLFLNSGLPGFLSSMGYILFWNKGDPANGLHHVLQSQQMFMQIFTGKKKLYLQQAKT